MKDDDLVIVIVGAGSGSGSGDMLASADTEGWKIAVVESDRFGGTCLNRGCIPSRMFVYAVPPPPLPPTVATDDDVRRCGKAAAVLSRR